MDIKKISGLIQVFVVITGVLLSGLSGWLLYQAENKAIISEFQKDVNEVEASLYREMALNIEALRSLTILFEGNSDPTFKHFSLRARKILNRHSGIQALEWIPRIISSKRIEFESKLQQDFPEFEIIERKKQGTLEKAGERPEYFPVYYIEPLEENEEAFGFNLASNPTRLEALEAARDKDAPQLTASITLIQEQENQKGFLVFLPVYIGNPSTVAERRDELKGFVLGVYRVGDVFVESILNVEPLGIEISLVDQTLSSANEILYIHKLQDGEGVNSSITYSKELPELWGRKWSLIASPSVSYINARRNILPITAFISGVIITLFIAITVIISRRASTIQKLVTERTIALDNTNKKLADSIKQLVQEIKEREIISSELEIKNVELERFAYSVSHDLKSPLVTIKGFLGYLGKDIEINDKSRIEADFEKINSAADTMAALLNDLLELSRVGRVMGNPVSCNLTVIAKQAIELIKVNIDALGIKIEIEDMPNVNADKLRLVEIYVNLIENAIKFMGEQISPQVHIGFVEKGGMIGCFVRDNGIGIEAKYHELIFGLFERLSADVGGTGVGLTLVKRLVEIHAGEIWVESEGSGCGSTIWFTLPKSL